MPPYILWRPDGYIHIPWHRESKRVPWITQDALRAHNRHWLLWLDEVTS